MKAKPVVRLHAQRHAGAGAPAAVDVLLDTHLRLHGVDEAADGGVVGGDTGCGRRSERHVDGELGVVAEPAAVERAEAELGGRLGHADSRLVRDVAHRAGERARSKQGALRAAQDLDAGHVEQVEVRGEQRQRDDRLVEVDADLLLDARLVAHDLSGRDAAHRDLALAGTEVLNGEPGDVGGYVLDASGAVAERLLCGCDHREGHRLEVLLALAGGDRDRHLLGEVGRLASLRLGVLDPPGRVSLLRRRRRRQDHQQGAERPASYGHGNLRAWIVAMFMRICRLVACLQDYRLLQVSNFRIGGSGAFPISRSRAHTHRRHGHPLQTVPSAGTLLVRRT